MGHPSAPTPTGRVRPRAGVAALFVGAGMGAAAGSVAGCQLSAALGPLGDRVFGSGCAPLGGVGGALVGALLGAWALPLLRFGTGRRQPAAASPAGTTRAAAWLVVAIVVAAVGFWAAVFAATVRDGAGLEALGALLIGILAAVGGSAFLVLAWGLLRRRGWARWVATVACSLGAAAALSWLLHVGAALLRWPEDLAQVSFAPKGTDLLPPGVFLLASVVVVALLLTPATGWDFQAAGHRAPEDAGRRR